STFGGRERTFCGTGAATLTPTARPWQRRSSARLATIHNSLTDAIRCPGSVASCMAIGCGLSESLQLPSAPRGNLGREVIPIFGESSTGGPSLSELTRFLCWTRRRDSSIRRYCAGTWLPEIGLRTKQDALRAWDEYA